MRPPTPPEQLHPALKPNVCKPSFFLSAHVFEDAEDVIKANITDPLKIIQVTCENEKCFFLYKTGSVSKLSIQYSILI